MLREDRAFAGNFNSASARLAEALQPSYRRRRERIAFTSGVLVTIGVIAFSNGNRLKGAAALGLGAVGIAFNRTAPGDLREVSASVNSSFVL